MDQLCVRQKQIERVTTMLNLNSDKFQPNWKFLIYDVIGQNIIGPLLSIDKLKNENVTQHLAVTNQDREPVPDVSAIYFVTPNDKNIELICRDLTNHLYDAYYLNFISPLSRTKLEQIADASLMSDTSDSIKLVYDQYLNFISLEDDLFILREHGKEHISFQAFNRTDISSQEEINQSVDKVVDSLFAVLITLNIIPIIRSPKGGPAEIIADKLDKRIRETLRDQVNCLYNRKELSLRKRPLLCLVDRDIDMSTPLHHAWTYQALIHDTIKLQLNKVEVSENDAKTGKPKILHFELEPAEQFWIEQRGSPFPQVAEAIQRSLEDHKKREEDLNNLRESMGLDGTNDEIGSIAESTAKLKNAALSLPEISKNKAILKKHTTVAAAVLDEIKARKMDNFFEIEEKIMNRALIDRAEWDEMIKTQDYGKPSDKYRLFLISFICDNPQFSEEELDKNMSILEGLGCNRSAYEFLRQWKDLSRSSFDQMHSGFNAMDGTGGGVILKTAGMFSRLMSKGSNFVMEGVKNLVLREHKLPLTKIIEGLMDTNTSRSKEALQYKYLDPKANIGSELRINNFKDAILFVVGGGNYVEYQNLVDYCNSRNKNIPSMDDYCKLIYGATDLMNAEQFLNELSKCKE